MVLSYSSVAREASAAGPSTASAPTPTALTGSNNASSPPSYPSHNADTPPVAGPSRPTSPSAPSMSLSSRPSINHLILDAGPLLSLEPVRHLATSFHTTPLVLAELKDPKARAHWEALTLSGVDVQVEMPSAQAMGKVVEFAKKTGDYAVLSQTDLSVLALTCMWEMAVNGEDGLRTVPGEKFKTTGSTGGPEEGEAAVGIQAAGLLGGGSSEVAELPVGPAAEEAAQSEVASDSIVDGTEEQEGQHGAASEDDSGGEWITSSNVKRHRNRDLGLLAGGGKATQKHLAAACMTGDYAVQNVLLGMGLGLVGEGGKRISKVKSWVLRCHACFKICRDPSKRFCPSCGNASLMRTSVSTSASTGKQHVHLKKNFQYNLRGTVYSIPDSKPGRAKGQQKGGSGLILREDQAEWMDAVKAEDRRREKEDRKLMKNDGELRWDDPDWLPEIVTVGNSGKGRTFAPNMPAIGHGRKNPNQARRKR